MKYNRRNLRFLIAPTEPLGDFIRKWGIICCVIGLLTGLSVVVLDQVINELLLGNIFGGGSYTGMVTRIYNASPIFSFILPFAGLTFTGLLLYHFTSKPLLSGTEEIIEHYHRNRRPLDIKEGFVKYLASILTIGLGGSTGLEGPSINVGGVIASNVWKKFQTRYNLTQEDLRILLLAGASAGIAAVFKAPLTGIIFALEVPYKDDLATRALHQSVLSGIVSYVTLVIIEGPKPLFSIPIVPTSSNFFVSPLNFAYTAILAVCVSLIAISLATLLSYIRNFRTNFSFPRIMRFVIGGLILGGIALTLRLTVTQPLAYGAGYNVIQQSLLGQYSIQLVGSLLVLRMVASAVTLGSGGVGGLFFPLALLGSLTGSLFALVVHESPSLWGCVGIAAAISAGYKTPLAAVTFIGDTTGSVSYLVLGMIASGLSYLISGRRSVSSEQIMRDELLPSELSNVRAADVMRMLVLPSLSSNSTVAELINECLSMRMDQAIFTDNGSAWVVSLQDALKTPPNQRTTLKVKDLPSEVALKVADSDSLDSIMRNMFDHKARTAAVYSSTEPVEIVGVISRESIFEYIEMRRNVNSENDNDET
jgi:chloride channel protein, CIC family